MLSSSEVRRRFAHLFGQDGQRASHLDTVAGEVVSADVTDGVVTIRFRKLTIEWWPPEDHVPEGLPPSFAAFLVQCGRLRIEPVGQNPLVVEHEWLDEADGWFESRAMRPFRGRKVCQVARCGDGDVVIVLPGGDHLLRLSRAGRPPERVAGTVADFVFGALVDWLRVVPPARHVTRVPIVDGALEVPPTNMVTLRPLLECYSPEERARITRLECRGGILRSTEGLELLPNVETVRLDGHRLVDLAGVESSSRLVELNVDDNQLPALPRSRTLERLSMVSNLVADLGNAAHLEALTELDCRENPLERIDGLEALERLVTLRLPTRARIVSAPSLTFVAARGLDALEALLALEIDGPVSAELAMKAEGQGLLRRLRAACRQDAEALRAALTGALERPELWPQVVESFEYMLPAAEVEVWGEFLVELGRRAPDFERARRAFAKHVLTVSDECLADEAFRREFIERFVPTPVEHPGLAVALVSCFAQQNDVPALVGALERALALGVRPSQLAANPNLADCTDPRVLALLAGKT